MPWLPRKDIQNVDETDIDFPSLELLPPRPDLVEAIEEQIGRFTTRETLTVSEVVDGLLDLRRQAAQGMFG
jgi:hypothetical protein